MWLQKLFPNGVAQLRLDNELRLRHEAFDCLVALLLSCAVAVLQRH